MSDVVSRGPIDVLHETGWTKGALRRDDGSRCLRSSMSSSLTALPSGTHPTPPCRSGGSTITQRRRWPTSKWCSRRRRSV